MPNLVELIKKAANEANEAGSPSTFVYGTVLNPDPILIQVDGDSKLTLSREFVVIPEQFTDYEVEVLDGNKRKVKILNALKADERVVLIRQQGGQKYLVAGRTEGSCASKE